MNYSLNNVVLYDGSEAYVIKFILKDSTATKDAIKYLTGNGEVLKVDKLYNINGVELLAMIENDETLKDRFTAMYLD